ncbi:MAG: hypothetical protein KBC69_03655 [Candidatus Magasanikbacteria bacterium]|nr:hypothetical protein [Candidatus Magasanikbacteria bacterium]
MSGEKSGYNPDAYDDGADLTAEEKADLDKAAAERRAAMLEERTQQKKAAALQKKEVVEPSDPKRGSSARKGFGVHYRGLTESDPAQAKAADVKRGDAAVEAGLNRSVRKLLDSFVGEFKFDLVPLGDGKKYILKLFVKKGQTFDVHKEFQGPFPSIMTQLNQHLNTNFSKKQKLA